MPPPALSEAPTVSEPLTWDVAACSTRLPVTLIAALTVRLRPACIVRSVTPVPLIGLATTISVPACNRTLPVSPRGSSVA